MVLLKVVHPLNIYQKTKFRGTVLSDASFTATLEVLTSTIFEWLKVWD
jgi:hypothetical protein